MSHAYIRLLQIITHYKRMRNYLLYEFRLNMIVLDQTEQSIHKLQFHPNVLKTRFYNIRLGNFVSF